MTIDKNQGSQNQKHMIATVRHVASPDAGSRLSRAIAMLLDAVETANTKPNNTSSYKKDKQDVRAFIKET